MAATISSSNAKNNFGHDRVTEVASSLISLTPPVKKFTCAEMARRKV